MKAWWRAQAERINALSLRERLFLFISVLVVLLAVADFVWLSPTQAAMKQVQQQFTNQSAEVNRLRAELAVASKPVDLNADVRAEIAQSQATLDGLQRDLQALAPSATSGEQALEPVLAQFLKRSPGLRLVSSGTIAAPASADAGDTAAAPGVVRRGLELKVRGPYSELTRYVKSLEQALPRLRWGSMQLQVGPQGPELTLQVYVLEVES
jgi:MSHA biogenesis protein MshJ